MEEFVITIKYNEELDNLKATVKGVRVEVEAGTIEELFQRLLKVLVQECREEKKEEIGEG